MIKGIKKFSEHYRTLSNELNGENLIIVKFANFKEFYSTELLPSPTDQRRNEGKMGKVKMW